MPRWRTAAAFLLLALPALAAAQDLQDAVTATEQFEYSYDTETRREIFENWLDVSYVFGSFRTGILLNAQQPSEEGFRTTRIRHRFFEFALDDVTVRAGHFYGLFGRGLVFASYEDRAIRVDTALDGVIATAERGGVRGTLFSGTPSEVSRDVRGGDVEADLGRSWLVGATGLTYEAPAPSGATRANREWVAAGRISRLFPFGDFYAEYGRKQGYDFDPVPDGESDEGHAAYGSASILAGPVSLVVEGKDYRRFAVIRRADGRVPLNNPPALTREHTYTLLSRNARNLDPDDEVGAQGELTVTGPSGWNAVASANRTERHDGRLLFEEVYTSLEKERMGPFRLRGAFGYQDGESLAKTAVGDATWFIDEERALTLQAQHQHVDLGGGPGFDLGEFEQQFFELEFSAAPHWTVTGVLEINNKYPEQRLLPDEDERPFPALAVSYINSSGGSITLWLGKRQAGQICTGGVCKFEPAFEGVELSGTFRY